MLAVASPVAAVPTANPPEQGLKPEAFEDLSANAKVPTANPPEQGLKQLGGMRLFLIKTVPTANPPEQGLKQPYRIGNWMVVASPNS